jgi:hypothetical protein
MNEVVILIDQAVFIDIVAVKAHCRKAVFQNPYLKENFSEAVVGSTIFDKWCRSHPVVAWQSNEIQNTLGGCCYRNMTTIETSW